MTPPRQAKLRGILAERGISQKAVAKAIGMNETMGGFLTLCEKKKRSGNGAEDIAEES